MPVTDLSCGTLKRQPLPRNRGLRTTTHVHRSIRLLELAISVYTLVAIIKKRLKIDVSFYTILKILSLFIFKQIQLNKPIDDMTYNPDERDRDNQLNLFNSTLGH